MITFSVIQGPDTGRRFVLPEALATLGRDSKRLPIRDETCSRRHAEIRPAEEGGWTIQDLGSSNGTYLNGERVHGPTPLKLGDQVRLGRTLLMFGVQPGVKPAAQLPFADKDAGMDSHILDSIPGNDDSVMLAAPDPAKAAMANLQTLYQLSAALGSSFSEERVLEVVMDLVFENIEADRGIAMLINPITGEPVPKVTRTREEPDNGDASKDDASEDEETKPVPASSTIVNHVLENEVGVLCTNAMTDRRFSSGKSVQHLKIRSALCVPIRSTRLDRRSSGPATLDDLKPTEETLGVIYVDSSVEKYSYGDEQLRLLTAIGWQAGLALQNAKLYRQGLQAERLAAVGETTAALSHGIKNILQALSGGADNVNMGFKRGDLRQAQKGWRIVDRNLGRIYQLTMNLLAWSKPRKPRYKLVHPRAVIDESLNLMAAVCADRNVMVLADVEADVPPVPLDQGGMHQVLMNLLTNALEAMPDPADEPDKPRTIKVACGYEADLKRLTITVSDTGTGIARSVRGHLFELFHSTKGNRGTGLGLPVVRKIVQEHEGSIDVDSAPGEGTTFTITLPIHERLRGDPSGTHGRM